MQRVQAAVLLAAAAALFAPQAEALRTAANRTQQLGSFDRDSEATSKNPIRKVVTLLQKLAKKVEEEGRKEDKLYEKYKCYCTTGMSDLQASISSNDAKVPAAQSEIEESESSVAKLKQDLKQHEKDRVAAKAAMAEATSLREKENEKFVTESTMLQGYVDALGKVIPAISSGMAGTKLLQTYSAMAQTMRKATSADEKLTDDDRQSVLMFLSGTSSSTDRYVPGSGEILGILKQMQGDFSKDLAEVKATEEEAVKLYDELIAAKTREVQGLGTMIETKTARVGELGVQIVTLKQEMSEAEAALVADQKFLKELGDGCGTKEAEYTERTRLRAEELHAIRDTITLLNDDDALDLFKKTLTPGASFVQVGLKDKKVTVRRALTFVQRLNAIAADRPEVRFLEFALQGKKVDFSKVIKMVDDMIALLAKEQSDDDGKKEYCQKQLDSSEDKISHVSRTVSDLKTSIQDREQTIAAIETDLKTLHAEVAELDKLVMEATEQRKKENEDYQELMSENTAAKELLELAKNRLHKFYNPSQYTTKEPSEEAGGAAAMFLQRRTRRQAPEAEEKKEPPSTWEGEYKAKGEETTGVIAQIDLLIRDLSLEMTEAEKDDQHAQKAYETFTNDSAAKRARSVSSIESKDSAKATAEVAKTNEKGVLKDQEADLQGLEMYKHQLHNECDWLLQNYDLRKTARADEAENLQNAKAVLNGAKM